MSLLINEVFCSKSLVRRNLQAKTEGTRIKITAGINLIFRGLFFEHNAEIGRKDH
jgi:hypothetical protein